MSREVQPCGTRAAYLRHRRNGEVPCAECSAANSGYTTAYAKEKRALRRSGQFSRGGSLPISAPEDAHHSPCFMAEDNLWEDRRDGELLVDAMARWRRASRICLTECPSDVFTHCDKSKAMAGGTGVWAGRIPGGVS